METIEQFLRVPRAYTQFLGGLRWSADGEVIEDDHDRTFAFAGEVVSFIEGFALQRPLIHFGHVLHLLALLRQDQPPNGDKSLAFLRPAFQQAGRVHRNAGVFCAVLCRDLPAVAEAPSSWQVWKRVILRVTNAGHGDLSRQELGEEPPLLPAEFEDRVSQALSVYTLKDMQHWLKHGHGPVEDAGAQIAEAVVIEKPRSLQGVLAELATKERLSGAIPYVAQLVSALTLPPRRLAQQELPLGGYTDVTTRGHPEHILPSQYALDDLEFLRRHAERELLYYRREEPHVQTREELVVLLDQGIRTWGVVRLVLAAALFALGQFANRRRMPFHLAVTSAGGAPIDPLTVEPDPLAELVQTSDFSAHPGLAVERVLAADSETPRDIVLLTQPFSLTEPDVAAAAKRLRKGSRLFAVAVDASGSVQFSEVRHGVPVPLARFQVDLVRDTVPPEIVPMEPVGSWTGDVEPVGFPFRFGAHNATSFFHFDFDHSGQWLLTASANGMLHATRVDGTGSEILPRGMIQGQVLREVAQIVGVAGGFVVAGTIGGQLFAFHYDWQRHHCRMHLIGVRRHLEPWWYERHWHSVIVPSPLNPTVIDLSGENAISLDVSPSEPAPRAAQVHQDLGNRWGDYPWLWISGREPDGELPTAPCAFVDAATGQVHLNVPRSRGFRFTPQTDGQPALLGYVALKACFRNQTLAVLVTAERKKHADCTRLCLYRLPHGQALCEFVQGKALENKYALSADGQLLARQVGTCQVEVRATHSASGPRLVTPMGGFHTRVSVTLGECWLLWQAHVHNYLIRWDRGQLVLSYGRGNSDTFLQRELAHTSLFPDGEPARPNRLPPGLAYDPERFIAAAWSNLVAVVDLYGQVYFVNQASQLICQFFPYQQRIAAWLPDGTCYGPKVLLGRTATPGALERIGKVLFEAWREGERTVTVL
jgi:hypothetical protein